MVKIVSMGVKDIFPLMKWIKILDLTTTSFSNLIPNSFLLDEFPSGRSMFSCSPMIVTARNHDLFY